MWLKNGSGLKSDKRVVSNILFSTNFHHHVGWWCHFSTSYRKQQTNMVVLTPWYLLYVNWLLSYYLWFSNMMDGWRDKHTNECTTNLILIYNYIYLLLIQIFVFIFIFPMQLCLCFTFITIYIIFFVFITIFIIVVYILLFL